MWEGTRVGHADFFHVRIYMHMHVHCAYICIRISFYAPKPNICKFEEKTQCASCRYQVFPILSDLLLHTSPLSALNCIFSIHMPISSCLVPRLVCISSNWSRFFNQERTDICMNMRIIAYLHICS